MLIAPNWVSRIDWIEEKLAVRMTRDKVKGSPEYAPEKDIDRRYEHDRQHAQRQRGAEADE